MELRKTSVVWNYKYADVEFGRLQARDLLQHLWTGPISNAPVDIVQVTTFLLEEIMRDSVLIAWESISALSPFTPTSNVDYEHNLAPCASKAVM